MINKFPDSGNAYRSAPGDPLFIKFPYGVDLQSDPQHAFKTIRQYEEWVLQGEGWADGSTAKDITERYNAVLSDSNGEDNPNNISTDKKEMSYFNQPIFTDTRLGCNDAMNPLWQFNRDDDIRPAMLASTTAAASESFGTNTNEFVNQAAHMIGMGRVYSETYEANQQILWIEAGVPRFTNIIEFYRDAADNDVAAALNSGTFQRLTGKFLSFAGSTVIWAITLPVTSIFYLNRWTNMIANDRITKYYSFQPAMTMYYETVNSMLQYVAVSMGLHPYALEQHGSGKGSSNIDGRSIVRNWGLGEKYENYPGVPEVLRRGPDIFRIMNRRSQMLDMNVADLTTRDLMNIERNAGDMNAKSDMFLKNMPDYTYENDAWSRAASWFNGDVVRSWFGALKGSALGSGNHIGFRIERGLNASESFSNDTGQTGLAQKLNAVSQEYKEKNETFGNSAAARLLNKGLDDVTSGSGFGGLLEQVGFELKRSVLSTVADWSGFDIGAVLMTGNGFLDIPEVWRSSSFSKSYSFNIQLRSRYGDPVSVFQSIYVPMLMLMALAAPRAIGTNMYTSPFIIRAFCRGMISIPLGIVTSLSIRRGRDEFGWTSDFLPTCVDVDLTIKDLSPALFLSMQDNGIFDTFSRNTNLHEYLDTLSGLGLKERIYFFPKFMRKVKTSLAIARSTVFSSTYWGTRIGRSNAVRAWFNSLVPFKTDRAPNN